LRIHLTCYRVLCANQDARAQAVLELAQRVLHKRAAQITHEARRRSFLENVATHREITRAYEREFAPPPALPVAPGVPPPVKPLTQRQTDVLRLIAAGLINKQIAEQLVISLSTVKRHVWNIYNRLEARNRAHAITKDKTFGRWQTQPFVVQYSRLLPPTPNTNTEHVSRNMLLNEIINIPCRFRANF
jgi:DNA-binding NarL/FixJ family response regulator